MDNKTIARILRDTAQLLEIDGAIIGRYRSYEKAAELISGMHESIEELAKDPDKLEELPGIGERMAEHLQEILKNWRLQFAAKTAQEISGHAAGYFAFAIFGAEESGVSMVELQSGHRCGRGETCAGRQAAGRARLW